MLPLLLYTSALLYNFSGALFFVLGATAALKYLSRKDK
jgi:hypothetical protein